MWFFEEKPLTFPLTFGVRDAQITLNADGTWSGDKDAYLNALAEMRAPITSDTINLCLWLVANAISK